MTSLIVGISPTETFSLAALPFRSSRISTEMSFFGFDAALPEDRPSAHQSRGIFEAPDPFAEVARVTAEGLHDGNEDV